MNAPRPARAYSDKLVEIDNDALLFRNYYFPWGRKRVPILEICEVEIFRHRKWRNLRIQGGDFRTWFPWDSGRPRRETTYILKRNDRWRLIGFTVEDAPRFEAVLKNLHLPMTEQELKGRFW